MDEDLGIRHFIYTCRVPKMTRSNSNNTRVVLPSLDTRGVLERVSLDLVEKTRVTDVAVSQPTVQWDRCTVVSQYLRRPSPLSRVPSDRVMISHTSYVILVVLSGFWVYSIAVRIQFAVSPLLSRGSRGRHTGPTAAASSNS